MVDDYNRTASKEFEMLPAVVTLTAAETAAAALAAAIAALSELRVLAYTISQRYVFTDAVTPGGNRDEGITITMRKVDLMKGSLKLPGPINSVFDENGMVITSPAIPTAVQDFIDQFEYLGATAAFTFSDGEQWTEFVSGTLDK
jgi:hypothetical protein